MDNQIDFYDSIVSQTVILQRTLESSDTKWKNINNCVLELKRDGLGKKLGGSGHQLFINSARLTRFTGERT